MVISSLVVVLVIYILAVPAVEHERDSPVSIDIYRPLSFSTALKWVKPKTRSIEVPSIRCRVHPRQNPANLGKMIRVETPGISRFKESLQSSVFEADNH